MMLKKFNAIPTVLAMLYSLFLNNIANGTYLLSFIMFFIDIQRVFSWNIALIMLP